jgi:hypothetical protein
VRVGDPHPVARRALAQCNPRPQLRAGPGKISGVPARPNPSCQSSAAAFVMIITTEHAQNLGKCQLIDFNQN